MCIYYVLLIHSSIDRYLGCFLFLALMSNAAVNADKDVFESFSILSGIYLGVELLSHSNSVFEEQH